MSYIMTNDGSLMMGAHRVFLPWGPKGSQSAPVSGSPAKFTNPASLLFSLKQHDALLFRSNADILKCAKLEN